MLRFTSAQRLIHKKQFDAVYKQGNRTADSYFAILMRPNGLANARLGLSVSARSVGGAVNRNRIKRVVRESFRLNQALLPAVDLVVSTRNAARDSDNRSLSVSLQRHWQEVIKRCARS